MKLTHRESPTDSESTRPRQRSGIGGKVPSAASSSVKTSSSSLLGYIHNHFASDRAKAVEANASIDRERWVLAATFLLSFALTRQEKPSRLSSRQDRDSSGISFHRDYRYGVVTFRQYTQKSRRSIRNAETDTSLSFLEYKRFVSRTKESRQSQ